MTQKLQHIPPWVKGKHWVSFKNKQKHPSANWGLLVETLVPGWPNTQQVPCLAPLHRCKVRQPSASEPGALPALSIFPNSASPGSYSQHGTLGSPDAEPVSGSLPTPSPQDIKTKFLQHGYLQSLWWEYHMKCALTLFFNRAFSLSIEISNSKICRQPFVPKSSIITLIISLLTSGICQPLFVCVCVCVEGGFVLKTLSVS